MLLATAARRFAAQRSAPLLRAANTTAPKRFAVPGTLLRATAPRFGASVEDPTLFKKSSCGWTDSKQKGQGVGWWALITTGIFCFLAGPCEWFDFANQSQISVPLFGMNMPGFLPSVSQMVFGPNNAWFGLSHPFGTNH